MPNIINLFDTIKYDSSSEDNFKVIAAEYHSVAIAACKDAGKIVLNLVSGYPNISTEWSYSASRKNNINTDKTQPTS
jgi:hypothetical protein